MFLFSLKILYLISSYSLNLAALSLWIFFFKILKPVPLRCYKYQPGGDEAGTSISLWAAPEEAAGGTAAQGGGSQLPSIPDRLPSVPQPGGENSAST